MWQRILRSTRLYVALLEFDRELAQQVRGGRCGDCGGRLDVANFPRKPWGRPARPGDPADLWLRLSFCCARCRSRATPPSTRFLPRRRYLATIVTLVTAMCHGVAPARAARLRAAFGVSRETLERWRHWWQKTFTETPGWDFARTRLAPPVDEAGMPRSLLVRFGELGRAEPLQALLRFIADHERQCAVTHTQSRLLDQHI